jgi:putative oxidoreductase
MSGACIHRSFIGTPASLYDMLLPVLTRCAFMLSDQDDAINCYGRSTMRKNLPMLLVRVIVGLVFLTEGILKFVLPGELGSGRFAHIGLPYPRALAPFVAIIEIVAGAALMLGVYAGDAAVLLLIVILTAIATTKVPILLGHNFGRFEPPRLSHYGLLSFLHEARTDLCMLVGCVAVLLDSGLTMVSSKRMFQR